MQIKDINLKVAQMPDIKKETKPENTNKPKKLEDGYVETLGIVIKNENNSVIIEDILSDSDIYSKGLKSGDVISKINDKEVTTIEDVFAYVDYAAKNNDNMIKVDVLSDKLPQTLKVSIKNND